MKRTIITVVFVIFSLECYSQVFPSNRANDPYRIWFETFLQRLNATLPIMQDQDRSDLQSLLALKPVSNSANQYKMWFEKGFKVFLENAEGLMDEGRAEKIEYLLAAAPDLSCATECYPDFLNFTVMKIKKMLPLDETKIKFLDYFKRALPKPDSAYYPIWLNEYGKMKNFLENSGSDDLQTVLAFLVVLQPTQGVTQERVFEVREGTLLKIRQMILSQQSFAAVSEIDSILAGGKK